jgi:hypothetical protein
MASIPVHLGRYLRKASSGTLAAACNMNHLKTELKSLDEKMSEHAKMQTLAWAINNCECNSFQHYLWSDSHSLKESQILVRYILLCFRTGVGFVIPDEARLIQNPGTEEQTRKSKEDFRDKLSIQIHELTGTKPRIIETDSKRHVIYFS